MSKKGFRMHEEELNYWQSISDVMAALLLIILLVMMLFILYMTRVPDPDKVYEAHENDTPGEYMDDEWGNRYHSIHSVEHEGWDDDLGEGGGSGSGNHSNDHTGTGDGEGDYEFEEIGFSDYEGTEKAAVYVTVKDGETGMTIKEEGITFQLYDVRRRLQTLSAYYPEHAKYESYETTASGNFFLPEKIALGSYYLTQISVPYGYDAAPAAEFRLEEAYDWDAPYAITVELFPCKNVIRIQNIDALTQENIPGAIYEVAAGEDIITADGTLRYKEGEVVDRIVCDHTGYGESEELYLGRYLVKELYPSEYYAAMEEDAVVIVDRKDQEAANTLQMLSQERTTFVLHLIDELHRDYPIAEAAFSLTGTDGTYIEELTTDRSGHLTLSELKKGTEYTLTQVSFPENYMETVEPITFIVADNGRIQGEAKLTRELSNRKIRITMGITDILYHNEISDMSLALYDSSKNLIHLWSSSAVPEELEGFVPGQYTLVLNGKEKPVEIRNTEEVQNFTWSIWSVPSILTLAAAGCILILILLLVINRIVKYHKKKAAKRKKKEVNRDEKAKKHAE